MRPGAEVSLPGAGTLPVPALEEATPDTGADRSQRRDVVIVLTGEAIGSGDRDLGQVLLKNFFYALVESVPSPRAVVLLNTAVRLAAAGSPVAGSLKTLEKQGVEVLLCSTSVGHLGVKVAAGLPTNMYRIVELLLKSGRVIVF